MRFDRALAIAAIAIPAFAAPKSDYAQLQKWHFARDPIRIERPLTFTRGTATWTLKSGSLRPMQPLDAGSIHHGRLTGMVFEGDGTFTMTVPDATELRQLRRFASKPDMQFINTAFDQLVLRAADDTVARLVPGLVPRSFAANNIATNRHNHWLIDLRSDVDAGVLAAIANGETFVIIAMKTEEFGWLDYAYDSTDPEQAALVRKNRDYNEVWISLRDGGEPLRSARLDHIEVKADLTHYSLDPSAGETKQRKIKGRYEVTETLTILRDGVSSLRMQLLPTAREVKARDASGQTLEIIRDHIGGRSASIDNKIYDSLVTVFFPASLPKGPARITFEYELETENYAQGRSWYLTFPSYYDSHTARLDLTVNARTAVRSMGARESEEEKGSTKRAVWAITKPTMMVTFSTSEKFQEEKIEYPGVPPITSFGDVARLNPASRIRKAGEDVAKIIDFFQTLLDEKLDTPHLFVTSITGEHGQAFEGFLHLNERSYMNEPGAEELFRAHETAHEWFGHKVAWKSYHDQWLTESFAEYLGMMYVEARVRNGAHLFEQILDAYTGIVKGDWSGGFNKFTRPYLVNTLRNSAFRARLGPISHGFRAGTGDVPFGYVVTTYYKGPLVVHMLRMQLRFQSGSDDLFIKVLRDFVDDRGGSHAATEDLQRIVERDAGGDWNWFFDQWVQSAEIPSLQLRSDIAGNQVTVTVKRSESDRLVVPMRIEFDSGPPFEKLLTLTQKEQTFTETVDRRPRRVVFAPEHSLLANVR